MITWPRSLRFRPRVRDKLGEEFQCLQWIFHVRLIIRRLAIKPDAFALALCNSADTQLHHSEYVSGLVPSPEENGNSRAASHAHTARGLMAIAVPPRDAHLVANRAQHLAIAVLTIVALSIDD